MDWWIRLAAFPVLVVGGAVLGLMLWLACALERLDRVVEGR